MTTIRVMGSPDAITVTMFKEGRKYISLIEMDGNLYIIKLGLNLHTAFVALAAAAVKYSDRWAEKKIALRFGGVSKFEMIRRKRRLTEELIEQTDGEWQDPIENFNHRGFVRLRLEGECRVEFAVRELALSGNETIRNSIKLVRGKLERFSAHALAPQSSDDIQDFRFWGGGRAQIRGG